MKLTLTKQQMLERLRTSAGLEPLRADCRIEITDGIDVDAVLLPRARARYLELLDTADSRFLAPENMASVCSATASAPADGILIALPSSCRRVFALRMEGWKKAVEVLPSDRLDIVINRQQNPFRRATVEKPVAVLCPGAEIRVMAWPSALVPRIETITGVIDPGEDFYTFDESAMAFFDRIENLKFKIENLS